MMMIEHLNAHRRIDALDRGRRPRHAPSDHLRVRGRARRRSTSSAQTVEQRLLGAPRFRQRIEHVPFDLGRPVWVDDERFDLDYHLRRTALPAPGLEDELRTLSNRLLRSPLDLRRALWENWLVEGLHGGRFALISTVHHCMVDGIATQDISDDDVLRPTPDEQRPADDGMAPGRAVPPGAQLVASGISRTSPSKIRRRGHAGMLRSARASR